MEASLKEVEATARHFQRTGCRTCDRVFTSTEAFDKHRVGEYGVDRECVSEPRSVGLTLTSEGYWRY